MLRKGKKKVKGKYFAHIYWMQSKMNIQSRQKPGLRDKNKDTRVGRFVN
jgi:hypothetical protein